MYICRSKICFPIVTIRHIFQYFQNKKDVKEKRCKRKKMQKKKDAKEKKAA